MMCAIPSPLPVCAQILPFVCAAGSDDEGHCDRGQRERPWPGNSKWQGRVGKVCTSDKFTRAGWVHQRGAASIT